MRFRLSALALALLLAACEKDINNTEALRKSLTEYLNARAAQTGIDMSAMTIEITSAQFTQETARAAAAFKPKQGGEGMNLNYTFDRKGDTWVVRGSAATAGKGHQEFFPGQEPAAGGATALPPNHPPVAQDGKQPVAKQ